MNKGLRILTHQLSKSYFLDKVEVPVLHQLAVVIEPGEFVAVTGPSGVGKSTLLHVIGTLDVATSGMVMLGDVDVNTLTASQLATFRNDNIGFVFQFHHLLPEFQAIENVMMPLLIRRVPSVLARERAAKWLEKVGLSERLLHRPGELSGGEQQRVALARALVTEPKLLLADEPTGNLDDATGSGIIQLMKQNSQLHGITTIMVTHHARFAGEADRQIVLSKHTAGVE